MATQPLIYLTGAPATGKTSVADYLCQRHGARRFSYGQALKEHASLRGISHEDLRQRSSEVVAADLITELDASLPDLLVEWRADAPVVIDSHAVTSEAWGLGAMPYSQGALKALGVSHLVCLVADGQTLLSRIRTHAEGRRRDDVWKLAQISDAQLALAIGYAHTLGIALSAIDARSPLEDVCQAVAMRCGLES